MIIANPIYDSAFKHLMGNRRIAKFFIETLIGERVEDIALVPHEYTQTTKVKKKKSNVAEKENPGEWEVLTLMRFDFVATICTSDGESKKVFVEIQKSNKPTNLMRFRGYLSKQYQCTDIVEVATGKIEKALPIICIYLFGFKLSNIKSAAVKVCRNYIDMIDKTEIPERNNLIESLTHDGYFVQIPNIKGKPRTTLERLLSIFEQKYFIDDKNLIKEYDYPVDDENLKMMVDILRHAAADETTRREMEAAWFAEEDEKEWNKELEVYKKTIEEKDKTIEEKDKSLEEKDKEIEELKKRLENLTK